MKRDMHVLPVNDSMNHDEARNCPCKPVLEDSKGKAQDISVPRAIIVIHNDGRE